MTHLPILPIAIPMLVAVLSLALSNRDIAVQRGLSIVAVVFNVVVAALLVARAATGAVDVYALGSWVAPFGIVLVVDRLAAMMVAVTAVIAALVLIFAIAGEDKKGAHFHPLFQLQIVGLNGAFLTGDAFNLFVFFEVLLIASYGLLVHGGGADRVRGGLHYVVVNLVGSTLFLFALAMIYGTLGTLNIADIAGRIPIAPQADQPIVSAALTLLVVVFALKGAIAPLFLWLPRAYPVAPYAIAALFAVMTKVGIYAILRFQTAAFEGNGYAAGILEGWLFPLAIATIVIAIFGMFSASRLTAVAAHMVLVSSGTLAAAIALGGGEMLSAVAFYIPHTVLSTAAMFLIIGATARQRGECADTLERAAEVPATGLLAIAFLIAAVALTGMPPLSGFLGKWMLLKGAPLSVEGYVLWGALIVSGFAGALVLARSGSRVYWEPLSNDDPHAAPPPADHAPRTGEHLAVAMSAAVVLALLVLAQPLNTYARDTAAQLSDAAQYRSAVIAAPDEIKREVRP